MGVLNVTPDSFSDGGLYDTFERAVAHGLEMVAEGADVVDVGGESSRPGAEPVPGRRRAGPGGAGRRGPGRRRPRRAAPGSRSTPSSPRWPRPRWPPGRPWSTTSRPRSGRWPRPTGAGWVAMHMQGEPRTMQDDPRYDDVVAEVRGFVLERAGRARAAGVAEVWVDPGIGFGKTVAHNLSLLRHLPELVEAAAGAGLRRGAGRHEPQALPRGAGGRRPARREPAPARRSGPRARWPRRRRPWWRGRAWCGSTTWRRRCRWPGCMVLPHEGQVGGRDPAPQLHLGDQGPPGRQRAARRVLGQPPPGAAPGGDHLAAGPGLRPGRLAAARRRTTWPPTTRRAWPGPTTPWSARATRGPVLAACYQDIDDSLAAGLRILVHQDELGDRVMGVVAGYLVWSGPHRQPAPGGGPGRARGRARHGRARPRAAVRAGGHARRAARPP